MQIFSSFSSLWKFSNRFQVSFRFPNKRILSFSLSDNSRSIMPSEVSLKIRSESYLPVLFLRDLSAQISFQEMLSKVRGKIVPEKVLQTERRSYVQENLSQNSSVGRSSESSLLDGSILCLERKNFFRLFFFFVLRRLNVVEKNFPSSSGRSIKRMWTPKSAVLGQTNWDKRRQKMNSQLKVFRVKVFRENFSPSQLKPKIFFQILFIPYLLCVGIFATLTTITRDNQGNKKISFFSEIELFPQVFALENVKKNDLEDWNLDFFFKENPSTVGSTVGATVSETLRHNFHQDGVHVEKYKRENFSNLKEIKLFCVEVLRGANYSSKLFLLWGFLQVWKGIRPGQSATGDTKIQVRFVTRKTNKKRLGDVQGVEKFSSILNLALKSLESNKTFYLRSFAFKNWDSFKMGLHTLLRPQVRSSNRSIFYPKGYLFVGPPGSGKTLLAQAIAGEANVTLLSLSASEIQKQVETGTRIGAIRCRNLFQQARQTQPCILFLDEIDSLGRTMTSQSSTNQDSMQRFDNVLEKNFSKLSKTQIDRNQKADQVHDSSIDRTLMTEFLIQMDSFSTADGFFVIGTTNFLDQLESAFIRSGRFDRILGLVHPGKQTRKLLLKNYAHKQKFLHQFTDSSDWEFFARKTEGKSAADLSKIINESALYVISQSFESGVWNSSRKLSHTNESILRGIEKISSRGNFN